MAEVRSLAVEYYQLTGKPLGVTGEIGEVEAADRMGLELGAARTDGYDAIRHDGPYRRIQIKSRWRREGLRPHDRLSAINISKEFDSVMLVLMRGNSEVYEIWEAGRQAVVDRLTAPGSRSRNERGQMGVSQFKSIADRVWPTCIAGGGGRARRRASLKDLARHRGARAPRRPQAAGLTWLVRPVPGPLRLWVPSGSLFQDVDAAGAAEADYVG